MKWIHITCKEAREHVARDLFNKSYAKTNFVEREEIARYVQGDDNETIRYCEHKWTVNVDI